MLLSSWRSLLGSRHLPLPLPSTLSLQRQRRLSTSHHLVPSLSLPGLSLPPYAPFLSLPRLCQRPPDCPCFTTLCWVYTEDGNCPQRWPGASKWTPHTSSGGPLPNGGLGRGWPRDVHLRGRFPDRGTSQPSACPFPRSVLLVVSESCAPLTPHLCPWCVHGVSIPGVAWVPPGVGECRVMMCWVGGDGAVVGRCVGIVVLVGVGVGHLHLPDNLLQAVGSLQHRLSWTTGSNQLTVTTGLRHSHIHSPWDGPISRSTRMS